MKRRPNIDKVIKKESWFRKLKMYWIDILRKANNGK